MSFLKAPQEVKTLMCFFDQSRVVQRPGEITGVVDANKDLYAFYCISTDVDMDVCMANGSHEFHIDHLYLLLSYMLNLIPVSSLVVSLISHISVLSEVYYDVGVINNSAIMGEEQVDKRAQQPSSWHPIIRGEKGRGEVG